MNYRATCLTPTLVGDGQKLSPIDYMVWRDQVNVLDQRRIFRLLAKGPRLDGYLSQLKKADKLDFASWGGFAQNFAGRRIPFEHPGAAQVWEKTRAEHLFIPTFAAGPAGPYLPASALKGALRTGVVGERWSEATLKDLAERAKDERAARRLASKAEDAVIGGAGSSRMKKVAAGDSAVVPFGAMKIYLLRVAALAARGPKFELGWKQAPRGASPRPEDATPTFAEMAAPGTQFDGSWRESSPADRQKIFQSANKFARKLLEAHRAYSEKAGLARLREHIAALEARLAEIERTSDVCMLAIGWGGGLIGKSAWVETDHNAYRDIVRQLPFYARAIQTGLPFPKTRRVVFLGGQPSALPGWVMLQVG